MPVPAVPARVAALAVALALLTGCSGGGSDSSTSAAVSTAESAAGAAAPAAAPALAKSQALDPLAGRSLVRTATLTVRVPDVRVAADRAVEVARTTGGAVAGEQSGGSEADLRLQVPPDRLDEALTRLARLGTERDRTLSTEDVTEQAVDLDSRLATQRASVARVRALLDRATGLGDVVKVEGELARREADLESLQSRARALSGRVDLAVRSLHLTEDDRVAATASAPGFRGGLDAGWHAFTATARVLAAVSGALLPFLPLLLLGAGFWRWRRRTV
ncbi:MAG: hypothetical protein JWN17_1238 [Frankiales bacterium]|nr:hypothetical protein [Frankiales bacterium]